MLGGERQTVKGYSVLLRAPFFRVSEIVDDCVFDEIFFDWHRS